MTLLLNRTRTLAARCAKTIRKHIRRPSGTCVFLIAQGRSGSTLLLELLNEIDGVNICGENWGATKHLAAFEQSLIQSRFYAPPYGESGRMMTYQEIRDRGLKAAWYNLFDLETVQDKLRDILTEMYDPEHIFRIWGFKEIRLGLNSSYEEFEAELDFLKGLFPAARFIFNTRDLDDLIQSGWWADYPEESKRMLTEQMHHFRTYQEAHHIYCYSLTFEDIISRSDKLEGLFTFMGEAFDPVKVEEVLSRPQKG